MKNVVFDYFVYFSYEYKNSICFGNFTREKDQKISTKW